MGEKRSEEQIGEGTEVVSEKAPEDKSQEGGEEFKAQSEKQPEEQKKEESEVQNLKNPEVPEEPRGEPSGERNLEKKGRDFENRKGGGVGRTAADEKNTGNASPGFSRN